jgi:hypothetical protein
VGDLSVGKHVKRVAQTFYARAGASEPALATANPALVPFSRATYGRDEAAGEAPASPPRRLLAGGGSVGRPAGATAAGRRSVGAAAIGAVAAARWGVVVAARRRGAGARGALTLDGSLPSS